MKKIRFVLVGAGDRGTTYAELGAQHCPEFELVGVADPDPERRAYIRRLFSLPEDACFETWETLFQRPKFADAAIIATQDRMHVAPAMRAIELGYQLLLEKPVAPTPSECLLIADAAKRNGVQVVVCHVLRFTPFFRLLKQLIDDGRVGQIVNIVHVECVGNVHQSHSYVRGNWHRAEDSAPMILAKSCHDLDIVQWLLGERCVRLQSFGGLSYFRRSHMPAGAPEFCVQGCPVEADCPYSALKIYRDRAFPAFVKTATGKHDPSDADIEHAITETDYGRCVFRCDNDVVDHQVVNLEYEDGATVSFTMSAFNRGGRKIRIMGTKGEIFAQMSDDFVTLFDFATRQETRICISDAVKDESIRGGHGGGDRGIIRSFCRFLSGTYEGNSITDIGTSVENHLVAFAAEASRLDGGVVDLREYETALRGSLHQA